MIGHIRLQGSFESRKSRPVCAALAVLSHCLALYLLAASQVEPVSNSTSSTVSFIVVGEAMNSTALLSSWGSKAATELVPSSGMRTTVPRGKVQRSLKHPDWIDSVPLDLIPKLPDAELPKGSPGVVTARLRRSTSSRARAGWEFELSGSQSLPKPFLDSVSDALYDLSAWTNILSDGELTETICLQFLFQEGVEGGVSVKRVLPFRKNGKLICP